MAKSSWLDRPLGASAPGWALERARARARLHAAGARAEYDGATHSRRSLGWRRTVRDANAELSVPVMAALRGIAHDLVRNNAFAARGVSALANNMVGTGITFQVYRGDRIDERLTKLARRHFDTTACDSEGRHDFYGLQLQAARTIVTSGGVLARRRWRRMSDGLPVPFQLQLLEPDYIDMSKHGPVSGAGFRVNGIEFDPLGRRAFYWLFGGHPGSVNPLSIEAKPVSAADVAHCFRADRPEQQHGATWFAPIILRLKDFGDYEDAQLVRQKIAACYTVFRIGSPDDEPDPPVDSNGNPIEPDPLLAQLEPGIVEDLPDGTDIKFAAPPGVDGYEPYSRISLQAIAAGLGVPYEALTGDLSKVNFSSGRMGWLEFQRSLSAWQWTMFIPQFCEPAGRWFLEAALMAGEDVEGASFRWTPPRREMIDPSTEVPAIRNAIRAGIMTLSEAVRERGVDPDTHFAEWASDAATLDRLGLIFDSDPRRVTSVGNPTDPAPSQGNPQREA
jgi:lambda family phage portal protein